MLRRKKPALEESSSVQSGKSRTVSKANGAAADASQPDVLHPGTDPAHQESRTRRIWQNMRPRLGSAWQDYRVFL
jgi:hypothetical protein